MESKPELEGNASRVIYTCWPFGGFLCGIATAVIGLAMILTAYFPHAPELVWGVALLLLGAFIALRSKNGERSLAEERKNTRFQ